MIALGCYDHVVLISVSNVSCVCVWDCSLSILNAFCRNSQAVTVITACLRATNDVQSQLNPFEINNVASETTFSLPIILRSLELPQSTNAIEMQSISIHLFLVFFAEL